MKYVFVAVVFYLWTACVAADNFTFTYTMVMRCKEYLCQYGYSYETFFELDSADRRPKANKEAALEMHIAILAASNGHILLSTVPHPEATDPVYEIVVGGGSNKFTELRRNLRRNSKYSAKTVNILSPIEFRAFYIRISEDGVIEFGKEGEQTPIISYNDVNPLTIKYFSFASWHGVEAKFLYDCPAPGEEGTDITPDSKEVEKKLSGADKVKRTLLMDRVPSVPPGPNVTVQIDVMITSVDYDAYDAKLTTNLAMVVVWKDNSLAWNPDKFNGTKIVKYFQGQIWRPTFFVFNSNDMSMLNSKNPELITMKSSGEAMFHFQTLIETYWFYPEESEAMKRWPNEKISGAIVIGAYEPHEKIYLQLLETRKLASLYANVDTIIQNEWALEVIPSIVTASTWEKLTGFTPSDNDTHQSDRLILQMQMTRRGTAYNVIFYTPLMVLATFLLLSFWDKPLQMSRVWFYTACAAAVSSGLCYINILVPCHTVPTVLILYSTVLFGVLIALLVQVMLMTSHADRFCKTTMMQSLLSSKWFRTIFCLSVMKTFKNYESFNEGYASQEDDDSGVVETGRSDGIAEMQAAPTRCGDKEELAAAADTLMFVVYSITFAVMLAMHY